MTTTTIQIIRCVSTPSINSKTSVFEFEMNNEIDTKIRSQNLSGSCGWGKCPADVLMMIFKELDGKSLSSCIAVNKWWRDIVDYTGQHHGLWPEIAKAAIANRGVTFIRKSKLNWRELYFNYRLWHHVGAAQTTWSYVCCLDDIKYLHVYKDILIVEHKEELRRKYLKIQDKVLQEFDSSLTQPEAPGPRTPWEEQYSFEYHGPIPVLLKGLETKETSRLLAKLIHESPFKRLIVLDDNCYYILDDKNVLRYFKWDSVKNAWIDHTLARYYGCKTSISDIHVYLDDVFILLKTGLVMRLDRDARNFEAAFRYDYPQYRAMQYARLMRDNLLDTSIEKVFNVDIPKYNTGNHAMFHEYSVVVSVPSDMQFRVYCKNGQILLECPDLSCATQHGDVLFLGYNDGRVEICLPKNILQNGGKPELHTNVQDYHDYLDSNPAIVALEVYEAQHTHHLFVATQAKVYKLILTYPDKIKIPLGVYNVM